MAAFDALYDRLEAWSEDHGIRVAQEPMDAETPGRFDGLSVTMNRTFDPRQRCFYFAHALGSIVRWALDPKHCRVVFAELAAAKKDRGEQHRLGRAIAAYRDFETASSEYAVALLDELGFAEVIPAYTNFWRADLESMTLLHLDGKAPPWPEFFARWNERVARGEQRVEPYTPRPVPPFRPVPMKPQEIVQEK